VVNTINEILRAHGVASAPLEAALVEREDEIADLLRLNGQQFGVYPEIVAEVIVGIGLGSPPDETVREMIRRQFVDLMERLQEEYRRQQGDG
jgi:hypothetical protein